MKQIILLFLFTAIFGISIFAQQVKPKTAVLPADIAGWVGQDSDKILDNPVIKRRLKKLSGKQNYADFGENWETLNPIIKDGNFLFSSGCLIHGCIHAEAATANDLLNITVHAAIYTEPEKVRYFNERGGKNPPPIIDWTKRL